MSKVITFGEIMLRLAPNGYYRFFQNDQMQATFGGGEANVAVSLANFGIESAYVTKLRSTLSVRLRSTPSATSELTPRRSFAAVIASVSTTSKRVRLREAPYVSTTAHTPRSQRHSPRILIGIPFSTARIGSTSRASLPLSAEGSLISALRLARLRRRRVLRSPATSTTAASSGAEPRRARL